MNQPWYIRLGWWLCEKTGHLWIGKGWVHAGCYHRECRLCGRIVSEPTEGETDMKVRIRKRPTTSYETWYVEVRKWYYLDWMVVETFCGDDAEKKALLYAMEYAKPVIREVKT